MTNATPSRQTSMVAAVMTAAALAFPAFASAQAPMGQPPAGPGGPGMMGRRGGAAMLLEGITLTDAQRTRIDSIQSASRERMRARFQATGGPAAMQQADSATRAQRRQEMMREQEADRSAVRAVLTADQQKTFDANVARMRERMQQRMREGGPGGMGPGGPPPR